MQQLALVHIAVTIIGSTEAASLSTRVQVKRVTNFTNQISLYNITLLLLLSFK